MADVFVSYAAEDGEVARYVAQGIAREGYEVWYYQEHGQTPGADYLDNIGEGVRQARVVVLFVSASAIASPQCNSEAQIAWEESKEVIPLLSGLSFQELKADKKGKRWADRIGTRVSIQIDPANPQAVLDSVLAGLRATRRTTSAAPSRAAAVKPAAFPAFPPVRPSALPTGTIVAGAFGGLGLLFCLLSLGPTLSPRPGTPEAYILANFAAIKITNVLVLLVGIAQNAALLYGAWLVHRKDPRGAPLIRKVAMTMLASVVLWAVICLFSLTGSRAAALIPNPADRSQAVVATFLRALTSLLPSAIVFWLFRHDRA